MEPVWRDAFERTVAQLDRDQFDVVTIDVSDLLAVARLLYDGALVAERTASFGHLLDGLGDSADPTVARIVAGGHRREATALVHDQQAVASALARARSLWEGTDVLLVPTAPGHPTTAEVTDDPVGVNSWLGTYTNFVNLLDMAALAMPVDAAIGRPFGITLVGPAFSDRVLLDVAARMRPDLAPLSPWLPAHHKVAVFGAHRRGGALTHELTDLGARFLREDHTAPEYTLHRLTTEPPRPGLVRSPEGASIICEVWALPAAAVSRFLTGIDAPLALGTVRLHDGTDVTGFVCEPWGLENSVDITASGGWLEHLASIDGEHR
jgi:allophanate hydrolase